MKRLVICSLFSVCLVSACKRDAKSSPESRDVSNTRFPPPGRELTESEQLDLSASLGAAMKFFNAKDIPSAFEELRTAAEIDDMNPAVLNLRGSCHVEMGDFEQALRDFTEAANYRPRSAAIYFNIGEVQFVSKRWEESIAAFTSTKELMEQDSKSMRDLIDFKIMLCHAGLKDSEEFRNLAALNLAKDVSLLLLFTKASVEFYAGNKEAGEAILADAARKFPAQPERAPWLDTLRVFGYIP